MAIREYRCAACDRVQERLESSSVTSVPAPACDKCGGVTERVEISLGSFRIYGYAYKPSER